MDGKNVKAAGGGLTGRAAEGAKEERGGQRRKGAALLGTAVGVIYILFIVIIEYLLCLWFLIITYFVMLRFL